MFEDRTFENIRDEMLEQFPNDIDIREGSIAYDSVTAVAAKVAMLYIDIANCYELTNLEKSTGEYLDNFASEHGVSRIPSTKSKYEFIYEGKEPDTGEEFYDENGDYYFQIEKSENGNLVLTSAEAGAEHNAILPNTPAIPVGNIDGLTYSAFGRLIIAAIDEEDDEALRARIRDKISGPSENGNKSQYKTWCESIEGVGRAVINPLKYGPNTVEAVIISPEGLPVDNSIVTRVQNKIDPKAPSYAVSSGGTVVYLGSGRGDGLANIGAHFLAVSAEKYDISVSIKLEINSGVTLDEAKDEIFNLVNSYLRNIALESEDNTVRYAKIGSIIEQSESVIDYSELKLNGEMSNISIPDGFVAVVSEVIASVAV